jgi:hypothetical protein
MFEMERTERDAALVRDLALAFAAGRYEGGKTLFDMYANIALKFTETRGLQSQCSKEPASAIADITRRLEDVIVMINSPGEYSRVYVAGACRVILGLIESLGHAQTPAALTILRKALEEICAGPLNTGAIYRGIALGALDQIAALSDTSTAYATVRNRKPTHDPYTNPNAHIYYECACGAILDPQTKSFAALNNHASGKGWKIRFTDKGYVPYCVKCGEGVE